MGMATIDENSENTYVIDTESAAEMARLIDQSRSLNQAAGSLLPENIDLSGVHSILDVACGPGEWAQEVAALYSHIKIVGTDISTLMIKYATQRARVQKLANASFQIMDARTPLAFANGAFDLVNARFMAAFLPRNEWPQVIKEFARVTRTGGTIVLTETDICRQGSTNSPAIEELNEMGREAVYRAGLYSSTGMLVTSVMEQFLQEAGCQDIQKQWHLLDFSAGTAAHPVIYSNLSFALKLVQPFLLKMGQATQEHLDELYERGMADMMRDDFHGDTQFLTAWGIKSA
jgi:ubiquinone/menaquinone biosynthesis C-methylase UbiE